MRTMRGRKQVAGLAIGIAIALGASGCQWDGLNSLPMPGAAGTGEGAWQITIQMPNVTTLTRNSPVRVNDVTVGTVGAIDVEGWHALVTVNLDKDVKLPANAVAKIGQTSLLGSNHLELAPPEDGSAQGELKPGDTIPLERAGAYPTTEQTLSSLSVVLNGGGISQLENITGELNKALVGNTDAVRDLLPQLNQLVTTLDGQTKDIIAAMGGLDRFAGVLAGQKDQVASAIDNIHPALTVLADRRETITNTLVSLGDLGAVVSKFVDEGGEALKTDLANLWPALEQIADTGNNLSLALGMLLTFPFPMHSLDGAVRGDYLNVKIVYDLTMARLGKNMLSGTPIGPQTTGFAGLIAGAGGANGAPADPKTAPLDPNSGNQGITIPGLGTIPGLPDIPGLTVPQGSGQ